MTNVLSLSIANHLSPALRYRIIYLLIELKKQGVSYNHISFYSAKTHEALNKHGLIKKIVYCVIDLIIFIYNILCYSRKTYSTVIIKTYLIPFGGAWVESLVYNLIKENNIVYDIDDGIYLNETRIQNKKLNFIRNARSKCEFWVQKADKITYPNYVILNDLKRLFKIDEKKCHCYLSAPYEKQYFINKNDIIFSKRQSVLNIIWLGSPSTQYDLVVAEPLLKELCYKIKDVCIYLIGVNDDFPYLDYLPQIKRIKWSKENEKKYMQVARFGLNPLKKNEFQLRKSAFKVIQYYRAGILPIVSDVGINRELINSYGGYCSDDFSDCKGIINYIRESDINDNIAVFEKSRTLSVENNAKILGTVLR